MPGAPLAACRSVDVLIQETTARSPVDPIRSGHQTLFDQVAPQSGVVVVIALELPTHLSFVVAHSGLEVLRKPLEDNQPFPSLGRDLDETFP